MVSRFTILLCFIARILTNSSHTIIGVISTPYYKTQTSDYNQAIVKASTVRWLEASGADSIVINPWSADINDILTKINGIVVGGDDENILNDKEFIKFILLIVGKIIRLFEEENIKIPILGINYGFQILHLIAAAENYREVFNLFNSSTNLIFNQDFIRMSKLFSFFENEDFIYLKNEKSTFHYHLYGISPEIYEKDLALKNYFKITSTSKDSNNNIFISSVESNKYPIYAVQFNPDDIVFSQNNKLNIVNSNGSIRISRALGNYFVQEAKSGNNNILLKKEFEKYNYIFQYETFPIKLSEDYYFIFKKS